MQAAPSGRDKAGRTWGLLCHLQGWGCRIRRGWQAGGVGGAGLEPVLGSGRLTRKVPVSTCSQPQAYSCKRPDNRAGGQVYTVAGMWREDKTPKRQGCVVACLSVSDTTRCQRNGRRHVVDVLYLGGPMLGLSSEERNFFPGCLDWRGSKSKIPSVLIQTDSGPGAGGGLGMKSTWQIRVGSLGWGCSTWPVLARLACPHRATLRLVPFQL